MGIESPLNLDEETRITRERLISDLDLIKQGATIKDGEMLVPEKAQAGLDVDHSIELEKAKPEYQEALNEANVKQSAYEEMKQLSGQIFGDHAVIGRESMKQDKPARLKALCEIVGIAYPEDTADNAAIDKFDEEIRKGLKSLQDEFGSDLEKYY
jgi:hypothetical protein